MQKPFNVVVVYGLQVGINIVVAYGTEQYAVLAAVDAVLAAQGRQVPGYITTTRDDNAFVVNKGGPGFTCGATVFTTYTQAMAYAATLVAQVEQ